MWGGAGHNSHYLCDLSSLIPNTEEKVLFKSCAGNLNISYLGCGVMYLLLTENHRPKPLEVGHLYHQELNRECPFLRKQTWKGGSDGAFSTRWMRKASFGTSGFVKLVHPQFLCLRNVLCLPGQPLFCHEGMFHPFRWVCAFCKERKKGGCIYTFLNIFKSQSTRGREGGAWCCSLEIGKLTGT